ncbi:MAG: hypothetical protein ACREIE_09490 [Nitrospiraceae bacterium]
MKTGVSARSKHGVSREKAKEILRHGEVRGHKLTRKQRGFFGARAGGLRRKIPTRTQDF